MKPKLSHFAILAAALAIGTPNAGAQNLKDWKAGDTITGEAVDFEKLKGRVVVVEYWGPR